jgi:hypothetical protein
MKDKPATGHSALKGGFVAEVAGDDFCIEVADGGGFASHAAYGYASLQQDTGYVPAEKAGDSCDQGRLHKLLPLASSPMVRWFDPLRGGFSL